MRVLSEAALMALPGKRSVVVVFSRRRAVAAGVSGVVSVAETLGVADAGAGGRAASDWGASAALAVGAAVSAFGALDSCGSAFGCGSCPSSPQPPLSGAGGALASDFGTLASIAF